MATSNASYLKTLHSAAQALGAKAIASDFTLEIEGFEQNYLLCKQMPWPQVSSAGEIEVPGPVGSVGWEAQQVKVNHSGQVAFYETVAGSIDQMLVDLISSGGKFNAKIYAGTPQRFSSAKRITKCFLQIDNPDCDWENRSQVLMFSGTMFFHYFGEILPGNASSPN